MSLASMTELAVQRRSDVGTPHYVPKTHRQIAGATGGKEAPDSVVNTALKIIVTYIPTEVRTLYLAVVAALQQIGKASDPVRTPSGVFLGFWLFTPVATWLIYAAKVKNAGKPLPTPREPGLSGRCPPGSSRSPHGLWRYRRSLSPGFNPLSPG